MSGIFLSGMASGLDTQSIISQLMALEQNKVTAVQRRQVGVQQHKDDLGAIKTKLDALKSAFSALSDTASWKQTQTSTSSDPTKIEATLLGGAGIGGHSIQVDRLASSAQHGYDFTAKTTAGTLTLYYGTDANAPGNSRSRSTSQPTRPPLTSRPRSTPTRARRCMPRSSRTAPAPRRSCSHRARPAQGRTSPSTPRSWPTTSSTKDNAFDRTGTVLNAQYTLDGEQHRHRVREQRHRQRLRRESG